MTQNTGGVDLLGFEKNISLKDKQTALENKLAEIRKLKKNTQDKDCDITKYKSEAIGVLQNALTVISNDVSEIQKLRIIWCTRRVKMTEVINRSVHAYFEIDMHPQI